MSEKKRYVSARFDPAIKTLIQRDANHLGVNPETYVVDATRDRLERRFDDGHLTMLNEDEYKALAVGPERVKRAKIAALNLKRDEAAREMQALDKEIRELDPGPWSEEEK